MALGFEELPDRANFHKVSSLALDFLHAVEEFEGPRVALAQGLFEVPAKTQVTPKQHVGIYVTPNVVQVGNRAHFPVEICGGRD